MLCPVRARHASAQMAPEKEPPATVSAEDRGDGDMTKGSAPTRLQFDKPASAPPTTSSLQFEGEYRWRSRNAAQVPLRRA